MKEKIKFTIFDWVIWIASLLLLLLQLIFLIFVKLGANLKEVGISLLWIIIMAYAFERKWKKYKKYRSKKLLCPKEKIF